VFVKFAAPNRPLELILYCWPGIDTSVDAARLGACATKAYTSETGFINKSRLKGGCSQDWPPYKTRD
jgi:hypothetical protein